MTKDRFESLEGGVLKIRRQHGTTFTSTLRCGPASKRHPPSVYASGGHPATTVSPGRAALLIPHRTTLPDVAQIDIDYAGRSYTVPSTKENRDVLKELGVYAAEGRIEVLTLDGDGFALSLIVGPTIPIAVSYIDDSAHVKTIGWWPSHITCLQSASWFGRHRVNRMARPAAHALP